MSDTKIKTSNIGNLAVTHALLHTDMDLTSKTVQVATPTSNTHPATKLYVDTEVANLIDSAPGTLDTLNELAAAVNDDANFNATIASSIATKLPLAGGTLTGNLTLTSTASGSSASPELELRRDITGADANYLGQIKFTADNDADQNVVFAKITGKILDASDGTEDGIIEFAHQKAGSNNISARFRSDSLQLINGTNLTVAGTTELTGNLTVDTNTLYVDTSNNRVGIGTGSPTNKLTIDNGSSTGVDITSTTESYINFGTTSNTNLGQIYYSIANNRMSIRTNDNNNVYIDSNGRVGIGDADPVTSLDVRSSINTSTDWWTNGKATIFAYNTNSSGDGILKLIGATGTQRIVYGLGANTDKLIFSSRQAESDASKTVVIDNNGNVGIGTSSPSAKLSVHETSATGTGILLTNNNNTAGTYSDIKWQYTASDSSYASGIRFKQLNSSHGGQLEFFTDNTTGTYTQRMTITENGNVGIGKTDPSAKLHTVEATSDTITAATAGVKFDGSGSDGLAFGNIASAPHSSWIQAGYLANGYSPAFNSGYPIALNPIGGNVGIGITNPSEELHIYDAGSDPYVLVDGSGSNRDSGYKINAGNGVKIAARADSGGNMYFADNAILVGSSNGNGQYRSIKIDSEIVLRENSGTNPSEAIIARMLGCRDIAGAGGSAILGGQGDTLSGHALRKNGSTGTNTFFFGPYGTFPAGSFTALFRIKIGVINSGSIGQIDVVGSGCADASGPNVTNRSRSVSTSDFTNGQYRYFPIDFDRTSSGGGIEFRWLNANSNADVYLDHILIVPRITR